jgi:hypothetical protein
MPLDALLEPFEFPEDLSSLSAAQREELSRRYTMHVSTAHTVGMDSSEVNPSHVIDPSSDEFRKIMEQRQRKKEGRSRIKPIESPFKFDPKRGFIVEGEDIRSLGSRADIDAEVLARIIEQDKQRPKPVDEYQVYLKELASMDAAERDAKIRFGNL